MPLPARRPGLRTDLAQVPHGHTAQRLHWRFLPPDLRDTVEARLGSPVVDAESKDSGFTPGFASVLTGEDGNRVFLKAASKHAQAGFAGAYLDEARKLEALAGAGVPAPPLLWTHEDEQWVALGFAAVEGRPPQRPWVADELERALDLAEAIADATDPVPDGLDLHRVEDEIPGILSSWSRLPDGPHREEAAALAASYAAVPQDHLCHSDLRDDNVLLATDGRTYAVDWNWCVLGPAWQDTVDLLVSAYGDGVDVEPVLRQRRLTRDVDPDHVDRWLAALGGYLEHAAGRRAPTSSLYLTVHSRWYAEALWGWLSDRRGWA